MTIELRSLVVFGHHGYLEEERRLGQRFLVDLWVDVRGDAAESDHIDDTARDQWKIQGMRPPDTGSEEEKRWIRENRPSKPTSSTVATN